MIVLSIRIAALCVALTVLPANAHKIGSETSGTETPNVPSVESCATFAWTKKDRCGIYDTTDHLWEVKNSCPRAVKVLWSDNAYNKPIPRGEESGKPKVEFVELSLRPGKTLRREVSCVDRAELEICIEYVYPPLKEHDVNCAGFFDRGR